MIAIIITFYYNLLFRRVQENLSTHKFDWWPVVTVAVFFYSQFISLLTVRGFLLFIMPYIAFTHFLASVCVASVSKLGQHFIGEDSLVSKLSILVHNVWKLFSDGILSQCHIKTGTTATIIIMLKLGPESPIFL